MKVVRSLRLSSSDPQGNWKTEEISVELEGKDLGFAGAGDLKVARDLSKVLVYECDVVLCKTLKDPCFEAYIKERLEDLRTRKVDVDDTKRGLGIK